MSGNPTPSSNKKPPRGMASRVVMISFAVAFVVVCALVFMAWLVLQRSDSGLGNNGDASAPQQGVEIWRPEGSAAASQTYRLPPAADMNAVSQPVESDVAPVAVQPRRAAASAPAEAGEVPIQPVAPIETEIRPIDIPTKPAPQPQPRQPSGGDNHNPVDNLF